MKRDIAVRILTVALMLAAISLAGFALFHEPTWQVVGPAVVVEKATIYRTSRSETERVITVGLATGLETITIPESEYFGWSVGDRCVVEHLVGCLGVVGSRIKHEEGRTDGD